MKNEMGEKTMYKQYIIKYKLRSLPFYYECVAYEESTDSAITAFYKEYPIGVERFYIAAVLDI
jgi:hypothetical protein